MCGGNESWAPLSSILPASGAGQMSPAPLKRHISAVPRSPERQQAFLMLSRLTLLKGPIPLDQSSRNQPVSSSSFRLPVSTLCRVLRLHSPCCGIDGLSLPRPQHAATCCPQVEYLILLFKVFPTNFNAKETGVCWSWDLKCPPPLCAKGSAIAGTVR